MFCDMSEWSTAPQLLLLLMNIVIVTYYACPTIIVIQLCMGSHDMKGTDSAISPVAWVHLIDDPISLQRCLNQHIYITYNACLMTACHSGCTENIQCMQNSSWVVYDIPGSMQPKSWAVVITVAFHHMSL